MFQLDQVPMILSAQIRAARSLLGLSQPEVAAAAGVSVMTVKRAEGSGQPPASTAAMSAVQRALEKAGVVFIPEDDKGIGVRLSMPGAASQAELRDRNSG